VKKLLLILLLIALPYQFAWAAAAAYCDHEKPHPVHFGHHVHHHQAQEEKSDKNNKLPKFDSDCGYCHLSCHATPLPALPSVNIPNAVAPPDLPSPSYYSYYPEGLQRPDQALVA
jgi:hypothetical protein